MFELKEYVSVQSLEQGHDLLMKDKNNVILGGLLWMKMGKKTYHTGIDLSGLGLNKIVENDESIDIGCMTSLRQAETSPLLHKWFGSLFSNALGHIVGIQFRNCATIGGSVYSRFGFSDVLTAMMIPDTHVHLYHGGIVPLSEFLLMPRKKDILVKVCIKKQAWETCYQSQRLSATDFPILCVAAGRCNEQWRLSLGARPDKARQAQISAGLLSRHPDDAQINSACDAVVKELSFGNDLRGSKAYREILAKVLLKRGIQAICR
ncbi:FAD binding domain-containing protein [Desulfobacula toluolica]|uniref:HcrB2: predicted 4-hydroxybenzoyl-CoA reductase, beta subunit n=1 Tax=Desulfobacula toluolica (strain DSM 7467 / Tol2) TaxID=651182 RepID=K0N710_DESTT|nr:FAD binding domain-containing protein [Desulfobacula toluolica]CCK79769.1 HcrB2: predicted 4-hydroxybenzoyl-CoA reductase, beta subunit [Desulfobacula toluolica Tol2]